VRKSDKENGMNSTLLVRITTFCIYSSKTMLKEEEEEEEKLKCFE
jgi:hypothetical protein